MLRSGGVSHERPLVYRSAVLCPRTAGPNRMTGIEIPAAIVGAVIFFITVSGALWGIWWKIDSRVESAKTDATAAANRAAAEAASVRADLVAHKLHAAETFATKAGMQEQTSQLLRAIEGVVGRIDGLGERLDNIMLHQQKPTPRPRS